MNKIQQHYPTELFFFIIDQKPLIQYLQQQIITTTRIHIQNKNTYLIIIIINKISKPNMQQQLTQIIRMCSIGKQVSNSQLRWMISSLCGHVKQLMDKQNNTQNKIKTQIKATNNQSSTQKKSMFKAFKQLRQKIQKLEMNAKMELMKKLDKSQIPHIIKKPQKMTQKYTEIVKKQITGDIEKLTQKLKPSEQKFIQSPKIIGNPKNYNTQILKTQRSLSTTFKTSPSSQQFQQFHKQKIQKISALNWVDPQCIYYNRLLLFNNIIISRQSAWVFCRYKLKGQCSYSVTFKKIGEFVGLGVVDSQNRKQSARKWNDNFVVYLNTGQCSIGPKSQQNANDGFYVGQTVIVKINLFTGLIQWRVGSQIRHSIICPSLKNTNIIWVPYIGLSNKDSQVEINQ